MPPDTRQKSHKGDENIVMINFLRGSEIGELINEVDTMPIIYGSSDDNCTIKAATRYVHFHAFRLDPDLTDHDLEAYLRNRQIDDVKCTRISSKHPDEYSSMPIIYGSSDDNCTIKAATRYVHFHAFRLDPDLTDHDLEAYLRNRQIDDVKCTRISSKHPDEYSSLLLTITILYLNTADRRESMVVPTRKHGGVCIFARHDIECTPINLDYLNNEINFEIAGLRSKDFYIFTIYRSPLGDFDVFLDSLTQLLDNFFGKTMIISGDFNVKFNTSDSNATILDVYFNICDSLISVSS
ncbi:hypothetical protein QE152_g17039 [Popillia japonica]|uniref:Endonuclease/exonuclease/phosphatase domain-containing protein n=1 Tax=Popillia japonica TaxID=7064 RepID=A0AAW1L6G8_POPJA